MLAEKSYKKNWQLKREYILFFSEGSSSQDEMSIIKKEKAYTYWKPEWVFSPLLYSFNNGRKRRYTHIPLGDGSRLLEDDE